MKPFAAPANANASPADPLLWALHLPMASYAAALDVAACQMQLWVRFHQAAADMQLGLWQSDTHQRDVLSSPVLASATADIRAASAAVIQAQIDAMDAFRRSA